MKITDPVTFIAAQTEATDKQVTKYHPEAEHAANPTGGDGFWLITIPGQIWDKCCEEGSTEWISVPGITWYISETR
jgi:hypothetical protein